MKLTNGAGYLLAAVLAMPGLSIAAQSRVCKSSEPTPASSTWNFKQEASTLLQDIQYDAAQVQSQADELRMFARNPMVEWETHAFDLQQASQEIDDIGAKLCRLETIRTVVLPWEKTAIDRSNVLARTMAANTDQAIRFVNTNREHLWSPEYRTLATNLYNESRQLSDVIHNYEHLAQLRTQEMHLRAELRNTK